MHILVTGGAGFLGKHLCRRLVQEGHTVKVLDHHDNDEMDTTIGDVRDAQAVSNCLEGVSVVFHLASSIEAGESVQQPYAYMDNNILGSVVLLEEMRKANVKTFIFSSTAAVYGEPIRVPIFEDDRTQPINPYGVSKLAMEGLASSYTKSFGFTCVALRYFNLYGPGENHEPETHAIPRFIQQIRTDQEVTIWGSGEHQRDYVFVSDIVDAHIKALSLPQDTFHYMNLSGKNATKVIDVIEMIGNILGKTPRIHHFPERPGDPLLLFADGSKAKQALGWEAQTELHQGLEQTIAWFLKNFTV